MESDRRSGFTLNPAQDKLELKLVPVLTLNLNARKKRYIMLFAGNAFFGTFENCWVFNAGSMLGKKGEFREKKSLVRTLLLLDLWRLFRLRGVLGRPFPGSPWWHCNICRLGSRTWSEIAYHDCHPRLGGRPRRRRSRAYSLLLLFLADRRCTSSLAPLAPKVTTLRASRLLRNSRGATSNGARHARRQQLLQSSRTPLIGGFECGSDGAPGNLRAPPAGELIGCRSAASRGYVQCAARQNARPR